LRLLALESATESVGVALASEEGVLAELTLASRRQHVELLQPAVETVLGLSGSLISELDAVAVDVGPGLFTGIRVGVAAAKATAMALSLPVVAVTSLAALRHAATEVGPSADVVAVIDLRRGEVAWSDGSASRSGTPSALATELGEGRDVLLVGAGALRHRAVLAAEGRRFAGGSLAAPPVASIAMLAGLALAEGRTTSPERLAPCYMRGPDARINWDRRPRAGRPE
jgi:tRNA threonylcarbamoyladenosine biosynthesis protein TsaB